MKNLRRHPWGQGGFTLVELMLVTALIGIITPAMTFLFMKMNQGMAADEMHLQLEKLNGQTMLRLHERIIAGHHLFQGDNSGTSFLGPVTNGMTAASQSNYPILGGTKLAISQPIGVTVTFSPTAAVTADFGNSLLFAAYDFPQTIANKTYLSPVTVVGSGPGGAPITYGSANGNGPATVVLDLYRFFYYYLTPSNPRAIRDVPTYGLMEWESIQYADINEINSIGDGTLRQMVIKWLATAGNPSPANPSYAVTWAWDPDATDPNAAFYTLSSSTGVATQQNPMNSITEAQDLPLTRVSSGILSTGFSYGIAPNSTLWAGSPAAVPEFGVASGNFPGGFEVGIAGTSAGRQILTRCLLVAKGGAPRIIWNDQTMVHNLRDVW